MECSQKYRQVIASSALALSCLLAPIYLMTPALASAPMEQGEGAPAHFRVPVPETMDGAVKLLHEAIAKLETSLAASDFSAIHEASYSVESAIARIGKEPGYDGVKALVSPRCEIVHLASEMEDGDTLKAAVPHLVKAVHEQLPTK